MARHLILLIVLSFSFISNSIFAVGLGEYKLISSHNQPLEAEIQILSSSNYNENEFTVRLASEEEYEKRGIERSFSLNELNFKTIKNRNGEVIIKITTNSSFKEPHLNFLIEVNWPRGKIIREYSFLFDVNSLEK